MTARDDLAALLSRSATVGKWNLDAIASLATNPETAPAVFRWLVEAGVLSKGDESCCDCTTIPVRLSEPPWDKPWDGHYHAVLGGAVTYEDDEIDPYVESVQDECPICGAFVLNPALHKDWHERLLAFIDHRASQYVPPPTYGGYR